MRVGFEAHKSLLCRLLTESFQEFEPDKPPGPVLDEVELARLRGVPFRQEVAHAELRAGRIVDALVPTLEDKVLRDAMALQEFEKTRHIVIFTNWIAWREARHGRGTALVRGGASLRYCGRGTPQKSG
jgi:hypothetical protein